MLTKRNICVRSVFTLLLCSTFVSAHGGHSHEEEEATVKNGTVSVIPDGNIWLMLHMLLGTAVTLGLFPAALGFVSIGRSNLHKWTMLLSVVCVIAMALFAMFGFLQEQPAPNTGGDTSVHAKLGWSALFFMLLQSVYGGVRVCLPALRVRLPILPHRYFGVVLVVFCSLIVWSSGIEHYFTVCSGATVVFPLSLSMMCMGAWRMYVGPGSSGFWSYVNGKALIGLIAGLSEIIALNSRVCGSHSSHGIYDFDLLTVYSLLFLLRAGILLIMNHRRRKKNVESFRESAQEASWSNPNSTSSRSRTGLYLTVFSLVEVLLVWLWVLHMDIVAGPLVLAASLLAIAETEINRRLLVSKNEYNFLQEAKLSSTCGLAEFTKGLILTGLPLYQSDASGAILLWLFISFSALVGLLPLGMVSESVSTDREPVWERYKLGKFVRSTHLGDEDQESLPAEHRDALGGDSGDEGLELVDRQEIVTV